LWARIIALADAYANMLTEQSIGRGAYSRAGARRTFKDERHRLLDGMLVRLLLRELKSERASSAKDGF